MPRQWKCAVVGTGVVGEWHVRTVPTVPNAKLVAVCDTDPARTAAALEKNKFSGIPQYTDLRQMLDKEEIDVVHVCTPSGAHMDPCITAMEAGKNVICEKPLEIQLDRIDRMNEVAKKKGVHLAAIFQNRWNEANRVIKQAADEGRFGRISWAGSFTCWYRDDRYYENGGWRGTWKLDGGGAVMNQSVHSIDLLQWMVGPVKTVSAYAASRIHASIEVEDTLTCSLQFANGAFGTIVGTTAMYPGQAAKIEIGGENGTAISQNGLQVFRFRDERESDNALRERLASAPMDAVAARVRARGGEEMYNSLFGASGGKATGGGTSATDVALDLHGRNIHAILTAWGEGRDAETNGEEARKAVAIILAMYESVRKNGAAIEVK
jgi:UDP-N-acetyl-2-amino-2-deoxyglucuronate dehydrogenase